MTPDEEEALIREARASLKAHKGWPTQGIDYYLFRVDKDGDGEDYETFIGRLLYPDYGGHDAYMKYNPIFKALAEEKIRAYLCLHRVREDRLIARRMLNNFPATYRDIKWQV